MGGEVGARRAAAPYECTKYNLNPRLGVFRLFSMTMQNVPVFFSISSLLCLDRLDQLGGRILSVSLGVVLNPPPEVSAGIFHAELRLPLQLLVGTRGVRREVEDIASSPWDDLVSQLTARRAAEGLNYLEDGAAAAGAEVPLPHAGLVLPEVVECHQVAPREIENVDVVTDGGAVPRGVVLR